MPAQDTTPEHQTSPIERREAAAKQVERVQWLRSRVERMRDLRLLMKQMLADNQDILWGPSWVGPRLFEAAMHMNREIPAAEEWLASEERKLNSARSAAGVEP